IAAPGKDQEGRILLRLVNRTPRLNSAVSEFVDPNLYGVRAEVVVPRSSHRPTIFRELANSFRYDREMPAVGINSHPEARLDEISVTFDVKTIALASVPRLVPRRVSGAEPRFEILALDPIPVLRLIAADMSRYLHQEWEAKIASLTGSERDEA